MHTSSSWVTFDKVQGSVYAAYRAYASTADPSFANLCWVPAPNHTNILCTKIQHNNPEGNRALHWTASNSRQATKNRPWVARRLSE